MPEFSVIVPVYKAQKYIGRCIKSILAQTFTDFQLILIDDGSPDNSGKICDQYAEKDNRILVIHQDNKGVSAARNAGLKRAIGKYIVFVDSDDSVDERYLECMVAVAEDVDLVICGVKYIEEHLKFCEVRYENKLYVEVSNKDILNIIANKAIDYAVSKRFIRKILETERIYFQDSINLSEDTLFVANYLCACRNIQCVDSVPYRYYKYADSTLSCFDENYVKKMELADEKIAKCLENYYGNIRETLIWKRRCFSNYYYSIFHILRNEKYSWKEKYKLLKSICEMKTFRGFIDEIDNYMYKDNKKIRKIIATGNPLIILVMWEIVKLRKSQRVYSWR